MRLGSPSIAQRSGKLAKDALGGPRAIDAVLDRDVVVRVRKQRFVEPLHLVTLASDRVDWDRTTRYADSARASRYISTRAEQDYATLTDEVAQALEDISKVDDAPQRLAIVERARKLLAEWPGRHYNYK